MKRRIKGTLNYKRFVYTLHYDVAMICYELIIILVIVGVHRNHPVYSSVCLPASVQMSGKHKSSSRDQQIHIKLYTVAIFDLRLCLQKDNLGTKYFKGDNSRERISSAGKWV